MTPNILKSNVGGGAGYTPPQHPITGPQSSEGSSSNNMDGDHTAKTMEQSANSATEGATDLAEGLHESPAVGEKTTGRGTSIFSKEGAIGKQFNADGAIGGTAQSVGGPLDKRGMVGKHFNADGSIGGTLQQMAEKNEQQ